MDKKSKNHFCISVAGHIIAINTLHEETYTLCKRYLCDSDPEIEIDINEEDLSFDRAEAKKTGYYRKDSYLETLAVYRRICEAMLSFDTILIHGAVISVGNEAIMFSASSGTGKTTHIKKWLNSVKDTFVVNGDKPLINVSDSKVLACGTPWCGKEQMGTNAIVPLKAIVLMERGENNTIEKISFGKAFPFLLEQTFRPNDPNNMRKTLALLLKLDGKVGFYKFRFNNFKDDAVEVPYNTLIANRMDEI